LSEQKTDIKKRIDALVAAWKQGEGSISKKQKTLAHVEKTVKEA